MSLEFIKQDLIKFFELEIIENGFKLNTHCLYPNNSYVRVLVMGSGKSYMVSDDGGAINEAINAGANIKFLSKPTLKKIENLGLHFKDGAILTPFVDISNLISAINIVANTSKSIADSIFESYKINSSIKFKSLIKDILKDRFGNVKEEKFTGSSNKPHTFEAVISLANGAKLLIDPVSKDADSVNARVIANLDVKNADHPNIIQRIIYDDSHDIWNNEDLSLLSVSGVPVFPFSKSDKVISSMDTIH
jgi:hypothetical protein